MQAQEYQQKVFIVDDDPDVRDSLQWLLESVGLTTESYENALDFINAYRPDTSGCIILDVRMPGLSGINAQRKLPEHNIHLPVIMISAHGNVDMAVTAMTQGAVTFIEKPFDDQVLIDHVHSALERDRRRCDQKRIQTSRKARYDSLTRREKEVFELITSGLSNQEAADALNINRKTVEGHRAKLMAKMEADSLAELVQMAIALGIIKVTE
ncbi:DNA-binding response regulator [Alkalilimnicola ehrlichii]|uniref:DNA-binding response regulator n=1 Tax=Alkalilimnicola ehrlichii TaxID=351052 RepID=A0A3E0WTP1_9GAMM|nr:response regulator [Alkalilimnicola ehrlichii]RFA28594.1 DNA-binding response regulator [Alkalilimnicola ehrlichii]RFA35759.1 DNA-binding response regulator [Alkalilimnicola ehrlichii]